MVIEKMEKKERERERSKTDAYLARGVMKL